MQVTSCVKGCVKVLAMADERLRTLCNSRSEKGVEGGGKQTRGPRLRSYLPPRTSRHLDMRSFLLTIVTSVILGPE